MTDDLEVDADSGSALPATPDRYDASERRLDGRLDDRAFNHLVHRDDGQHGSESPDSNIELLSESVRYPRSPLVALLAIAIIPSIALILVARWSDGEADEYEQSREAVALFEERLSGSVAIGDTASDDSVPDDSVPDDSVPGDSVPDGAAGDDVALSLTTAMFDYRRAPAAVTAVVRANRLRTAVDPVLTFIGDESCAAVSVDGMMVTAANPDLPVIPASNQKLLVATAALAILGPDYRFSTSVAVPAAVDGVIEGDIYLIGGGDPLLTSNDFDVGNDALRVINPTSLDVLADALADEGITRIRGTVIGDGSRYDDEFVVDEWGEGVALTEAGPYDALMANDSRVGGRSSLEEDPTAGAAREFARLLNDRDIRVDNDWGSGVASNLVPILETAQSAPLSDVVAEMLLTSDNNTAELLLKELGVATADEGTRAAGLNAMAATLTQLGVPMDGVTLRDGSGLSNQNRVTCAAMLKVVQLGAGGPIDAGMPIAAVSGTLAGEFIDTTMAGRLRAKTGTLTNVKALAGYVDPVDDPSAGTIEFVLIANSPNINVEVTYRPLWEAFGDRLASYPSGPEPDSLTPR
jgi:serine-type D-Ala-D-Ala carboxypeptidase/endopeptidase (penicillin-binding protein 4)